MPTRIAITLFCAALCLVLSPDPTRAQSPAAGSGTRPAAANFGAHGLQQVALTTKDLPRAIAFYRDALGLRLLFESNDMAFFDVGGVRLMIALDPDRPSARPTAVIYFDSPSFHAARAALEALGVAFEGAVETVDRRDGAELKLQQFRDPDGNALAVMGWVSRT